MSVANEHPCVGRSHLMTAVGCLLLLMVTFFLNVVDLVTGCGVVGFGREGIDLVVILMLGAS